MRVINYNNRNCLDLRDEDGKVGNFTLLFVAESGSAKGTSSGAIAERWKNTTGGVVISLNDPKQESEGSFVQYFPIEKYHLKGLRRDGIKKKTYSVEMYHPFSFHLTKKGFLPPINFFSISIKDLTREDWSILAETDAETETIKLLERVSEYCPKNTSLFDFLLEVERLTEGKKGKGNSPRDKKNWGLKEGGGTAKSIKQIGNMMSSFQKDYFLRKDTCEFKLNFEKILLNPEPYHVFLTNWIENPKTRNFLVEFLLGQFIRTAQRLADLGKLKTPILFLIPELNAICPDESKGSSTFLAKALRKHLITIRSKAGGMSCVGDCQIWSQLHTAVRGSFKETFYGNLNPEDARIIFKAKSYTSEDREKFLEIGENKGSFLWDGKESFGVFGIFLPSHMHKEEEYNWIQMYKKHFRDNMRRYDDLVNQMRKEYAEEESVIDLIEEKEKQENEEKNRKKEEKKTQKDSSETIPKKDKEESKAKEYLYKRSWELHNEGLSDRKIAEEIKIGSHKTVKKYYLKYEEQLKKDEQEKTNPERILPNLGAGVLPEEIQSNFGDDPK